jgi:hypothetical protein
MDAMPYIADTPAPIDAYTGLQRELVELIGRYCHGGQPELTMTYANYSMLRPPADPLWVRIRCNLKLAGQPATFREAQTQLWAAAIAAMEAIETAGWRHYDAPDIRIGGDRFCLPDGTWDHRAEGWLEMNLCWKDAP